MKVFLSSTALDLVAYRKVADDTILRLSQQTVAMERFGPLPGKPVQEWERLGRESDVVVCVVAHRYGSMPGKGKGSISWREVEAEQPTAISHLSLVSSTSQEFILRFLNER